MKKYEVSVSSSWKNRGQTSVEYILLVGAIIVMMTTLLGTLRDRFLPASLPCPANDKSISCRLNRVIGSFGTVDSEGPNFRYFRLRR